MRIRSISARMYPISGMARLVRMSGAIRTNDDQNCKTLGLADRMASGEPAKLNKAAAAVESVGSKINRYWKKYEGETIDWAIRIPVLTAGVAALGWAGANMLVGTTALAALVGGEKILKAISKRAAKSGRKKK